MKPLEVDAVKLARNVKMSVRLTRCNELIVRLWIGKQLIKLAGWAMGMGIEIREETEKEDHANNQ